MRLFEPSVYVLFLVSGIVQAARGRRSASVFGSVLTHVFLAGASIAIFHARGVALASMIVIGLASIAVNVGLILVQKRSVAAHA